MEAIKIRQALEAFKVAHPNWISKPELFQEWEKLQRNYERALFGYSII